MSKLNLNYLHSNYIYIFNYYILAVGLIAQRLEQRTHNPQVRGSNPCEPTKTMFKKEINNHIEAFNLLKNIEEDVKSFCNTIIDSLSKGGILYIIGNGGSASDANHLAAELIWRFEKKRKGVAAISLNSDMSVITSISNDQSFDNIFSRQVETLMKKDDILLCISTSGESINIVNAIKITNEIGICSFSITGDNQKSSVSRLSSHVLNFPSSKTSRIQEMHLFFYHYLCKKIDALT
jgi:D-sedoheptulose 7-phosphate isomerase